VRPPLDASQIDQGGDGFLVQGYARGGDCDDHHAGVGAPGTWYADGDRDEYGQATPPAGPFSQVSSGYEHACAVATAGTVTCWGIVAR
jgi:hypothetical protein